VVILGVGDGIDAGAALVIDDAVVAVEPQERHDRSPRSRAFPWAAIAEVLEEAGLKNRHVDEIAVAGKFTPPLFLRKNPGLRRIAQDAFSPAIDAGVFFQALLKQSGLGALEADYAAEWLEQQFRAHGFDVKRVTLVDIHRALAETAYRSQPHDEAVVITLHPMGDGAACAVHVGSDGQLERAWSQKGFESLHVHLRRCAAAMGFEPLLDEPRMWAAAGRATADNALLALLDDELFTEGERLSRKNYPLPETRGSTLYRRLAETDRAVAAASVLANLVTAVRDLVRYHVRASGCPHVVLGGAVFDNPRLCAEIAEIDDIETLWVHPGPGYPALPIGAAASLAGLAPKRLPSPLLGRRYEERQYARALAVSGLTPHKPEDTGTALGKLLAEGKLVARFQHRAGLARHGNGTRTVLFRADDPGLLIRARAALGRPEDDEPVALWLGDPADGVVRQRERLSEALYTGVVAPEVDSVFAERYPGVTLPDRRALVQIVDESSDPVLFTALLELQQRTGVGCLGGIGFSEAADPVLVVPGDAIRVWRRTGLDALQLGPFQVLR
jgi:carbamoyltransferase